MSASLTVWLLQTGEPLPVDADNPRPMRAMNLASALVAAGHSVVLWSSAFNHQEKRHRVTGTQRILVAPRLEVRLIASPGYQRNIGLARLWDHAMLARNLARELAREHTVPDVAFIGFPPIETAAVMARWLARRAIPCVVDVKDQWPDIFIEPLPRWLRPLGRAALVPYYFYARRAMQDATSLSAMADSFLRWATGFCGRPLTPLDRVVPLTTPAGQVSAAELEMAGQWWDQQGIREDGAARVFFVGTHTAAFDMEPVRKAASALAAAGSTCQFVIAGSGPSSADWHRSMDGVPNVHFPGWIDRARIEALARRSTAALAPYRNTDDFMMSIPNKVIDALALGVPLLSPLRGEVLGLITGFGVGMAYGKGSGVTLEQVITRLKAEPQLRAAMSSKAHALYCERFSFETVYGGLVDFLERLARSGRTP